MTGATVLTNDAGVGPAGRSRWYRPPPPSIAELEPSNLASGLDKVETPAVLIPCSDEWAQAVAGLPKESQKRFPACTAAPAILAQLVDKEHLAANLARLGLPAPATRRIESLQDLQGVADSTLTGSFLKPVSSQSFFARFGQKAFQPQTGAEWEARIQECQSAGLPMLLQEYVPGPPTAHFFLDGMVDRTGTVRARFARRRLRMYPPPFGNSTLMVSIDLEEVRDAVTSLDVLLQNVGYRGIFSAEFKRDSRDGLAKLIEVNIRPWWYVEFATRCGINVCALAVLDALELPVPSLLEYEVGKRCVFPYYDLSAIRRAHAEGILGWGKGLRSWLGAYQPVFRWSDPLPALFGSLRLLKGRLFKPDRG